MNCVNINLLDILGCFHYILNAPRRSGIQKFKVFTVYADTNIADTWIVCPIYMVNLGAA